MEGAKVISLQERLVMRRSEHLAGAVQLKQEARRAQERLQTQLQWQKATAAMAELARQPAAEPDVDVANAYAYAAELKIDAELNQDNLREAGRTARSAFDHVRRRAPGTLAEVMLQRSVWTVRELRGEADAVIGCFTRWARDELAPSKSDEPLERLRHYQRLLTCAKRCASPRAVRHLVDEALRDGVALAETLEGGSCESQIACFYHVAGYTHMRFEIDRDRAVELLTKSLNGRPNTRRDLATRGMGEAERLLAEGDRDRAIEHFDRTLTDLALILPRHLASGRRMCEQRNLTAA